MKNAQLIVVPANSSINKIADLAGKVVAVQDDSTGSYIIDGNDEMRNSLKEYRKYPDFAAVYMDIDSGRVEAAPYLPVTMTAKTPANTESLKKTSVMKL